MTFLLVPTFVVDRKDLEALLHTIKDVYFAENAIIKACRRCKRQLKTRH
jgi:hypothetical protein